MRKATDASEAIEREQGSRAVDNGEHHLGGVGSVVVVGYL
jgi:hypothetical protein